MTAHAADIAADTLASLAAGLAASVDPLCTSTRDAVEATIAADLAAAYGDLARFADACTPGSVAAIDAAAMRDACASWQAEDLAKASAERVVVVSQLAARRSRLCRAYGRFLA